MRKADFGAMTDGVSLSSRLQETTLPLSCSTGNTDFPRLVHMKIFSYQHICVATVVVHKDGK